MRKLRKTSKGTEMHQSDTQPLKSERSRCRDCNYRAFNVLLPVLSDFLLWIAKIQLRSSAVYSHRENNVLGILKVSFFCGRLAELRNADSDSQPQLQSIRRTRDW